MTVLTLVKQGLCRLGTVVQATLYMAEPLESLSLFLVLQYTVLTVANVN